jgi:catechol 2,3-dioxygenase-like lactoylglutathione lyase family enzyme
MSSLPEYQRLRDPTISFRLIVTMELEGIDHVALAVSNIERSAQWYIDVLGFEYRYKDVWNGIPTFIGKGTTAIALFPPRANTRSTSSSRANIRMLHLAFRATRKNFLAAQEELKRRSIDFEFQDHEISHSIYFRDPDGHELEITTYELEERALSHF